MPTLDGDGGSADRADPPPIDSPDFGRAADDYKHHRLGFPESIMERLRPLGAGWPGQRVLDLGTGSGSLARLFAARSCVVVGLDRARELLARARELDREAGLRVDYTVGMAEAVGLRSGCFEVVCAGQCWHWFDRPSAAAEARRLLAPDGRMVIAHFDWLPLRDNVVAETERLILRFNPNWRLGGGTGVYPNWLTDLAEAGFTDIETFSYDVQASYAPAAWAGRVRASAGVLALQPEERERFTRDLTELLAARFEGPRLLIPHRVWAVVARSLP